MPDNESEDDTGLSNLTRYEEVELPRYEEVELPRDGFQTSGPGYGYRSNAPNSG